MSERRAGIVSKWSGILRCVELLAIHVVRPAKPQTATARLDPPALGCCQVSENFDHGRFVLESPMQKCARSGASLGKSPWLWHSMRQQQ